MAKDKDVIIKELEGIRDERRTHANTAQRIGSAMLSLLGCVENVGGNFLRKDKEDTAQKLIRFMEGLKLGDGEMGLDAKGGAKLSDVVVDRVHDAKSTPADRVMVGAQGFDLYMGDDGKSHMYVDYLVARAKFFAASAEVRKVSYSGGTTIFSNAGSTIAKVTYVFDAAGKRVIAYKCYALADDGTTRTMNWWHVGMMALCQTFNVKAVETEGLQNRYYWRMVIGVGQETLEDSKLYDYVILSNVREFAGGEAMLPNKGVRVLADETGRVLRWGGVAVATVYDGELVSMAELFAKQEKGRTADDGGNVIAQRVFYGYEAVNGGEPDAPAAGDVIVQVGDQIRWKSHGNVIKLSTSTEDNATDSAPAITMYHQIGALWETGKKDSEGQPVRNPYQWKEVTCVISPEQVLLNARRFKLFTDSVDNIIEPYVVMYTKYDSKIEQTARNIALKVSQTAVGRKNLLVGSDFRKQSDKWAGNDSYRPYISVLNQYGGCNSVVLENGANTYHGLDFFRVPVKTGKYTAGIMAKFNGKPESGSFAIYVARKDAADKQIGNNSWIPVDVSNVVVGQWSLYSTSFDIEDKCKLIDLCFVYTNNPTAWFAQPMLVEGDEYVGWSLSEDDAEYIGGNLLDNTDTLVQGGNLVVASGHLYTDANSYKGFPTRQVNLLESTGAFMGILEWDLSNDGVLTVGQDYMLSFWAKGNIGGEFVAYLYKDGNQLVFTEVLDRADGPNQYQAADGSAGVIFKEDYAWRKYWVHWRVVDGNLPKYVQIRCMKGCDLYVSQPKLEYGATVTEYRATKTDYIEDKSVAGKLLDTGIDLVHRKITMTADTAEFRANNGKTMAVFTADGLNTSLVKAERLETKGEEAVVKIADGMISVYGRANAPNIRFGVNAEGYAVMEYYDNAGNLLYDLGPAGMSTIKTQAAAISAQQFYPVTNTALTSPYTYELQCKSSMGSYDLKYLCAKGSNNDRLLFGREGFGQSGVLVSSNLGVSSNKAVFLHLYSAPRVNGQVVADNNADRGLTTQALAKAADGCYFTSDKNLAVNGRLNNVAIGEFIPFDVKTRSNMQDRILMLHENETISLPRLYFGGWLKQSLSSTTKLVKPDTVRLQVYGGGMFTQRGTWDGTMALEL